MHWKSRYWQTDILLTIHGQFFIKQKCTKNKNSDKKHVKPTEHQFLLSMISHSDIHRCIYFHFFFSLEFSTCFNASYYSLYSISIFLYKMYSFFSTAKKLGEQCFYHQTCEYNDPKSLCVQIRHNAVCDCAEGFHSVSYSRPTKRIFCTEGKTWSYFI